MTTTGHPHYWHEKDGHLTQEAFDTVVELDPGTPLPSSIGEHLAGCESCSERVAELEATIALLRQAPELIPGRSFQIPVTRRAPVSTRPKSKTVLERLQDWLLPSLPALRAATMAVLLLFVAVTSADVWIDQDDSGDFASISPASTTVIDSRTPTVLQEDLQAAGESEVNRAAPVDAAAPAGDAAQDASEPVETDAVESSNDSAQESVADAEETAGDSDQPVQFEPPALAEADADESATVGMVDTLAEATPLAPATPEAIGSPLPTDSDQLQGAEGDGWSGWRVAQAVLLAAFTLLMLTMLWLRQSRRNGA